jgi:hypothetical protein
MALIFDSFDTVEAAARFVSAVKEKGRDAQLFTNADEAANAGFFPFQLGGAAVVLVDRGWDDDDSESEIIGLVSSHAGRFAGT